MRLSEELSCVELVTIVTDYLEGSMSPRDRHRFEEHIVFCDGCANYLDHMRTTIALTGRLTEDDLRPETKSRLLEAFRDWKRE
ncbi:MAG: zf-HC2 domain-containing protein [Actinobacteria bacterium]|nr:zf-HC2 domain-containing protein [Actinomycetota bacterium]